MTTPTPVVTTVEPTKAKSWVALVGSVLTVAFPLLASAQNWLPDPWPAVVGGVLAIGTALGVRWTPYAPQGTVIVPSDQVTSLPAGVGYTPVPDQPVAPVEYTNPYRGRHETT